MVFIISVLLLMITVVIHSLWMFWILRYAKISRTSIHIIIFRNVVVISTALLVHLAEAGVFAAYYVLSGAITNWETGIYFSVVSYATVGYGDVLLPERWKLVGAAEGLVGALMVGWSVAVLVVFLQQLRFVYEKED